jgi:hypothetical protein
MVERVEGLEMKTRIYRDGEREKVTAGVDDRCDEERDGDGG